MKQCKIKGCERPVWARSMCSAHYTWSARHGWNIPTHLIVTPNRLPPPTYDPDIAIQANTNPDLCDNCGRPIVAHTIRQRRTCTGGPRP